MIGRRDRSEFAAGTPRCGQSRSSRNGTNPSLNNTVCISEHYGRAAACAWECSQVVIASRKRSLRHDGAHEVLGEYVAGGVDVGQLQAGDIRQQRPGEHVNQDGAQQLLGQ